MAQRRRGEARRERVVDVDDVELDAAEQPLERAADVDRQRRRARPRPARQRDAAAEREHRRAAVAAGPRTVQAPSKRAAGRSAAPAIAAPRLADRRARVRRRRDHDPVAALGQLGRDAGRRTR